MDDMPPRRSRRPQKKKKRSKESTFPLIPFLIGVIVLGFVIGAGFSMIGHRSTSPGDVAVATAAPTDTPTFAPATLAPLATPRPMPSTTGDVSSDATDEPEATDSPEPRTPAPHSAAPVATHRATPQPLPSAIAHAIASADAASPTPTNAPTKSSLLPSPVTPVPVHARAVALKTPPAPPSPLVASEPPQAPATTPHASAQIASATTVDADSDFGRLSASVVRQYLRALGRGDTQSAYGAFGVSPGSGGVAFPEQPVMQSAGQILSIQSRGNDQTQYVTVDIGSANGSYYATYGIRRTQSGAAVIATHSITKQ